MKIKKANINHTCHKGKKEIQRGNYYFLGMKGKCYCLKCGSNRKIKQKVEMWNKSLKPLSPMLRH